MNNSTFLDRCKKKKKNVLRVCKPRGERNANTFVSNTYQATLVRMHRQSDSR